MKKSLRFGIGARIFLAFGAIVTGTIVSGVVASMMLSQIGSLVRQVGDRNLPMVIESLEMSAHVGTLLASVPSLARAETEVQRSDQWAALDAEQVKVKQDLEALTQLMGQDPAVTAIAGLAEKLSEGLNKLHDAVGDRLMVSDQRNEAVRSVRRSFERVRSMIAEAMQRVQDEMTMASMDIGGDGESASQTLLGLVTVQYPLSQALAELRGMANQALNVLSGSVALPTEEAVAAAKRDFDILVTQTKTQLDTVIGLTKSETLRPAIEAVLLRGTAGNNLFNQRIRELKALEAGRVAMEEVTAVSDRLRAEVSAVVDRQRASTNDVIGQSDSTIQTGIAVALGIAAVSLLMAIAILVLYIARSLVARIVALQTAMLRLADGDLTEPVPEATGGDEVAAMAETVAVFKRNAIATQKLRADQEAERMAREERSVRLENLVHNFQSQLGSLVGEIGAASTQLDATAKAMSSLASTTTSQTEQVAAAAEEASVNVGTVATASEELAASIREISHQVSRSTEIAQRATTEAARTDSVVRELSNGAQKIGDVVELITNIASQTNLLALNATIEAARAGEAGKGFAVVANEVKSLASQTARATEDIGQQINQIQAATRDAALAINSIASIIGEVSQTFTSIAAAIEEQGASTNEIARNVQQAAYGTRSVTETIADVSKGASETGAAASQVLSASAGLARQSDRLRGEVDRFIEGVKAA